ncbi:MAG: hypothetical protein H7249_18610 [Chitinophagaceae bacterium]|nr:hypothetical protein [Oligoflexus sp.]
MYIVWLFPVLLLGLTALTLSSKRTSLRTNLNFFKSIALPLTFLLPWVALLYFRIADLWIYSCQGMLAAVLLLTRTEVESDEAWFKGAVSYLLGMLFLDLSLHPATALPFLITTQVAQTITASSFIVALFLLFGLPPLQLGVIDLGAEKSGNVHIALSLLARFTTGFVILITITQSRWMDLIAPLQNFVIGMLFLGIALTRLVLKLQSSVHRTLSYLVSSLVLSVIVKILYPDFGEITLCLITILMIPFYIYLNQKPPEENAQGDLLNWTMFRLHHPRPALHFLRWMRIFLYAESIFAFGLAIVLFVGMQWIVGFAALFSSLSSFAVNRDKRAFLSYEKAAA